MVGTLAHVLFFGDHASDKVSLIRSLVRKSKHSLAVQRYLDEATDALQLEFSRLSRQEHGWNSTFDSLLELAEANSGSEEEGGQNGILTCALCCIGRIGELIAQAEQDVSILGTAPPSSQPVEVIGLCMGLFPAAVAVAARDTSHIFTLAREILGVVFRMAHSIWNRMRLIDDSPGSWAQTFLGVAAQDVQNVLNQFHEECNIPTVRRIAVGVTSKGFVTLFGAPTTLAKLQKWPGAESLRNAPQVKTEAGGCVHTPYLPRLDIQGILNECSPQILDWPLDFKHKSRMASPDRCAYYQHEKLGGLLAEILEDVAHNVLRLDDTLDSYASRLKADGKTDNVRLVVMGQNGHVPAVTSTLKTAGISHETITDTPSSSGPSTASTGVSDQKSEVQSSRGQSGLIAIVGMSGRFPDNDTVQGFWEDQLDGKTHIREVPSNRFNVKDWHDPTLESKNSTVATKGAWLANPGLFDHKLFSISAREAAQIDPIHRYLLTCSYEALQHAGYNPGASLSMQGSNISTFFGQLGEDWHDIIHQQGADIYYVPGIARTFAPSRVNYHYKFGGGSYAVDSACASSITTIVLACQALQSRACDMALAGGGSMMYTPVPFSGLSRSGMISPTDGCRTFHDDADGYARGEGIGVVVLKRLEDALADNDNILGVIRGSARTFSTTTTSITHPSHESQERVYRRVLAQSSLDPSEIAYVEMHGTGTQAGDFEEMTSVINVMAPRGSRSRDNPLTVGTVKAGVGHGEAAAGVTALIRVLLMLRDRVVPAQPGWPFKINHRFPPLDPLNVRIATKAYTLKPSPKGEKTLKVLLNSFDASGGESCLAIEEPPRAPDSMEEERPSDPRTAHVVTLSGRTTGSLAENRRRLIGWLDQHPDAKLADLAYTTTARRMHEPLRAAYVVRSVAELADQLHDAANKNEDPKVKSKPSGRVFLFTGQGSQYAGMGSVLFSTNASFRDKLLVYQELASHMNLPHFVDIIADPEFDLSTATTTQIQLAIVALEICAAETLAQYGVVPTSVIGHSLGEYAALCIAGVLSITDALYLVGQRALLMERHLTPNTYAMLATSSTPERIEAVYTSIGLSSCNIACKNAPEMTVVSGTVEDIEKLQAHMKAEGARSTILRIPYGFHSAQVEPIIPDFAQLASGVDFKAPSVPVVSSFLGRVVSVGEQGVFGAEYLAKQCRGTVDFVGAVRAVAAAEKSAINKLLWFETGPEPVLIGLTRRTLPDLPSTNLLPAFKPAPVDDNWSTLSSLLKAAYLSGVNVNWPEFHKSFKRCVKLLELPLYAFDFRDFWHEPFQDPEVLLEKRAKELGMDKSGSRLDASEPAHVCVCSEAPASASNKPSFPPSFPGFPTTSLPTVENEEFDGLTNEMVANLSADTTEPNLLRAIEGHVVHGHVICPMSVLVDMALTAAKYCHFRLHGTATAPSTSITDINMSHALVLEPNEPRKPVIRVRATMRKHESSVRVAFSWIKFKGGNARTEETGGTCTVHFEEEQTWPASVNSSLFLVKARMDALRDAGRQGQAHLMLKPVIYRIFAETVEYSQPFRGIEKAIVDLNCRDAIASITLPADTTSGNFVMNPFWTDALTHLGGFFINSGLRYGKQDMLCMATGFDSWRVVGDGSDMKPGKTYTNYTFMQDVDANHVVGDCYILDEDDNLVQTLQGLKFQKLKRAVFDALFGNKSIHAPTAGAKQSFTHHPVPKPTLSQPLPAAPSQAAGQGDAAANKDALRFASPPSPPPSHHGRSVMQNAGDRSTTGNTVDLLHTILAIAAKEAGCREDDMVDEAAFADLGIDSLMGISILTVIKRDTGVDLDSTFFIQFETVGEARRALEDILGIENNFEATPASTESASKLQMNLPVPIPQLPHHIEDLPTPPLETLGLREALSNDWKDQTPAIVVQADKSATTSSTPPPEPTKRPSAPRPSAKIVHLSGPKAKSTRNLFLLADESGSSLSCIQLPAVTCTEGNPISVWGVESPFTKSPDHFSGLSIQELASMSLESIFNQQPSGSGPFLLGGLGAGAAVAIEVARLISTGPANDSVGLVLIDASITPAAVEEAIGVPGVRLKPAHLEHSRKIAAALENYVDTAVTLPTANIRAVSIVPRSFTAEDKGVLAGIVPGLQTRIIDAAAGKGIVMRFPAVESTGKIYKEVVKEIAV